MSKRKRADKLVGQHLYLNGEKGTPAYVEAVVFDKATFGYARPFGVPVLALRCRVLFQWPASEVIVKYQDAQSHKWLVPADKIAGLLTLDNLAFDKLIGTLGWLTEAVVSIERDVEIDPLDNLVPSEDVIQIARDRLARVKDFRASPLLPALRESCDRASNMRQYVIVRTMLALQTNQTVLG